MGSSDPKAIAAEAQEAENRGDLRKASSLYSAAALGMRRQERNRDARSLFRKAIQCSPKSARLYIQLALVENLLGNDEGAIQAMERFTEVTLRRGKVEEYRPYFEKHLVAYPSLRQIFYRGLLALDRTDAGPFLDYAQAAIDKGDWEEARGMLVDALKTRSRTDEVVAKLTDVLRAVGEGDALKALESFSAGRLSLKELVPLVSPRPRRAAASDPVEERETGEEDLDTLISRLENEMGISLQERHDTVRPLVNEFRRKSDRVIGSDTKTRIDLAISFFEMGLVEDAREELAKVPPQDERFLEAQSLIGEILFAEGSLLEALEVYQRCLRDDRAGAEMRDEATYRMAQLYERLGDDAQALRYAAHLEERSPTYRDIRQLKKGLEMRLKARGK